MNSENEPRSIQFLYFDPDKFPENTLKAFNEFCNTFLLRYNALYPDPPKVSIEAALSRWKFEHSTTENADPRPTLEQYDNIRNTWRYKDRVIKQQETLHIQLQGSPLTICFFDIHHKRHFLENISTNRI